MKKIAIICGGPSHEHEVSLNSTQSILSNINSSKYDISVLYISKKLECILFKPNLENFFIPTNKKSTDLFAALKSISNFDLAFLAVHGEFGEDGVLQDILEIFQIPYTGSDAFSSHLSMDKYRTNLIIKELDVLIPKTQLVKLKDFKDFAKYPVVIKPNRAGSSVGVGIVKSSRDKSTVLKKVAKDFSLNSEFLVQEFVEGLEISCGCLQKKDGSFIELPPIEIILQKSDFFDYNSKYSAGGSKEITPPVSISKKMSKKISKLACEAHKLLGCKVYSRSDFLVKGEKIYYLETNTLPGLTSGSLIPQEAAAAGISFSKLLDFIILNS